MIYLRFRHNGQTKNGIMEDGVIREIQGSFFSGYVLTNNEYRLEDVKLMIPCTPSKVVAVGKNYYEHVKEMGMELPENPILFAKLPHTYIGPDEPIVIPEGATRVDYEAELAVVIKKECRKIKPEEADEYLLGAMCLNDVTERDVQRKDGQWMRGKNYETFCPMGPYIVDGIDFNSLDIKLMLNGEVKQSSNTSKFMWNVQQLVSFISYVMPLYPGDVIATGTPEGIGPMKDGDIVEVVIEGIGTLRNTVVDYKKL